MTDRSQQTQQDQSGADEARRAFVIKLGKLAAYTPPAMLALMATRKASAQSAGGLGPPPPPPPNPG